MSSFACSDLHFNSVEHTLATSNKFSQYSSHVSPYDSLDHYASTDITSLVNTWHRINHEAVARQYGEHLIWPKRNTKTFERLTEAGLVKALNCLRYQIEIHHIKNVRKLTKEEETAMMMLDKLIDNINDNIVRKLPEYNQAKWEVSF